MMMCVHVCMCVFVDVCVYVYIVWHARTYFDTGLYLRD
jgi:hypothetical protein